MQISLAWLLVPLFCAIILYDLRLMRIPNALVMLFAIVALGAVPFAVPFEEFLLRVALSLAVLIVGLGLFALRLMGGGDIKLLSVLMLLIPPAALPVFGVMLSAGIFVGIAGLGLARVVAQGKQTHWRSLWDRRRFPLGLSIGMAGICFIFAGSWVTTISV